MSRQGWQGVFDSESVVVEDSVGSVGSSMRGFLPSGSRAPRLVRHRHVDRR